MAAAVEEAKKESTSSFGNFKMGTMKSQSDAPGSVFASGFKIGNGPIPPNPPP